MMKQVIDSLPRWGRAGVGAWAVVRQGLVRSRRRGGAPPPHTPRGGGRAPGPRRVLGGGVGGGARRRWCGKDLFARGAVALTPTLSQGERE